MSTPYTFISSADNEEAWLAARRNGIGASDAPTILGLNPYALKQHGDLDGVLRNFALAPAFEGNAATEMGKRFAPVIAQWAGELYGLKLTRFEQMICNPETPWLFATPDYLRECDGYEDPAEIKMVSPFLKKAWSEQPPEYVACQVLIQQYAFGARTGCAIPLVHGELPRVMEVAYDDDVIAGIIRELKPKWSLIQEMREEAKAERAKSAEEAAE